MGKRSNFERRANDAYDTVYTAVVPLLPFLGRDTRYCEPCFGKGHLAALLESEGHHCVKWSDLETDARTAVYEGNFDYFITNPPWTREILHPIIENLSNQHPTWLLFDADWIHTRQVVPYLRRCEKIVAIGRVKWIPGSKFTGKDNSCWYLFNDRTDNVPVFYGR